MQSLLLPDVDHYQVVFTIPDNLSSLTLGNRREMFNLLFRSAWQSLKTVIADEQQYEAAASMVLHTWNQKLDSHIHVHAVVPGGGPSLSHPGEWKKSNLRLMNDPVAGGWLTLTLCGWNFAHAFSPVCVNFTAKGN